MARRYWSYDNCTIAGATGASTIDGRSLIASNSDDPFHDEDSTCGGGSARWGAIHRDSDCFA